VSLASDRILGAGLVATGAVLLLPIALFAAWASRQLTVGVAPAFLALLFATSAGGLICLVLGIRRIAASRR
jgi:hypothetical protein